MAVLERTTPEVRAPGGRRRLCPRPLVALASGLLVYGATPPSALWILAPLGVAGLAAAVRGVRLRGALGLGLLAGLAYLVPLYAWARTPGIGLWLLLAAFEALLFAPVGVGLALAQRLPAAPLWGTGVWVLGETVRDRWPFGGLAWARLAFTHPGPAVRWASVGGAPLVSAIVALAGLLLAEALRRKGSRAFGAVAAAVLVVVSGLAIPLARTTSRPVPVAVVQGNVPRSGLDVFRQRRAVLANHVQQTLTLAADVRAGRTLQPALVVWPEDADDVDPFTDRTAYDDITVAAAAVHAPILVGAVLDGPRPGTLANTSLLFTGDGYAGQQYVKRHPVPFGEYLPFRSAVEHVWSGVDRLLPADEVRGLVPGEVRVAGTTAGVVICFEVADDDAVRSTVAAGAGLLVIQTNNASFGRGGETWQQLAMARLRAVEHGRPVLVASTSGASAVVDARGRVVRRSGLFVPAVLSADVQPSTARTVADRVGPWPDRVLGAVGVFAVALGLLRRRHPDERTP